MTLNPELCFVDSSAFVCLCEQAEACTEPAERTRLTQQAQALYHGPFLPADVDSSWTVSLREQLRGRFIRNVAWLAQRFADEGRWQDALDVFRRGIDADDLAEEFYQGAMRCCHAQGRHAEGLALFRRLRQVLSVTLGVSPSSASQALHARLRGLNDPVE